MLKSLYKKLFSLKGRINRKIYIMYTLFITISFAPYLVLGYFMPELVEKSPAFAIIFLIHGLVCFLIKISLQIRRFHDLGKSGLWIVLNFIAPGGGKWSTLAAVSLLCYLAIFKGDVGPNKYGEDPLAPTDVANTKTE